MVLCNFHIQHNNNLSFLRLSQGAFSLSCKQCATSVFNILIIYHSLDSVREPSLSCKQCATSVFNKIITYHSLYSVKEPSLSCKQCATSNLSSIIYYSVLGMKEPSLSLSQAVCNFCIQHINILSFITWSEGTFSLSQCFLV